MQKGENIKKGKRKEKRKKKKMRLAPLYVECAAEKTRR
jgi:hypothetical protein